MDENIKTMKLKVEGIECRGCAEDYEKIIAETDSMMDVSFDFEECVITIQYDASIIERKQVYITVRKLVRKATMISES
jgi:copper chaperone CopZ